jgi:hypothetical protein
MIFTYRKHCSWLDTQPQAGEEWISTLGFQVAQVDGKPVIVVNPQVKVDAAREADLKAQIEKLRAELTDEQELEASLAPEEVASDSLGDESMAALLELKKLLGK